MSKKRIINIDSRPFPFPSSVALESTMESIRRPHAQKESSLIIFGISSYCVQLTTDTVVFFRFVNLQNIAILSPVYL